MIETFVVSRLMRSPNTKKLGASQHNPVAHIKSKKSSLSINHSPSNQIKSKRSTKSRRIEEKPLVRGLSRLDYVWLAVYYVCLYAFYVLFWYSLWSLYLLTTDKSKPRREPPLPEIVTQNKDRMLRMFMAATADRNKSSVMTAQHRNRIMIPCINPP